MIYKKRPHTRKNKTVPRPFGLTCVPLRPFSASIYLGIYNNTGIECRLHTRLFARNRVCRNATMVLVREQKRRFGLFIYLFFYSHTIFPRPYCYIYIYISIRCVWVLYIYAWILLQAQVQPKTYTYDKNIIMYTVWIRRPNKIQPVRVYTQNIHVQIYKIVYIFTVYNILLLYSPVRGEYTTL